MTFAKIFETKNSQVVVMRDTNDDGEPAIKFYAQPEGFGVRCSTLSFGGIDAGEAVRNHLFNRMEIDTVELIIEPLFALEP